MEKNHKVSTSISAVSLLLFLLFFEGAYAPCANCDIKLTSFNPTVPSLPIGSPVTFTDFTFNITNSETSSTKVINGVSGGNINFQGTLFYTAVDFAVHGPSSGTQLASVAVTFNPTASESYGLTNINSAPNGAGFLGGGALTIPAAQCNDVKYLCLFIEPGTGADWSDSNNLDNYKCKDVTGAKAKCGVESKTLKVIGGTGAVAAMRVPLLHPRANVEFYFSVITLRDIIITNLALNAGNPIAKMGTATSLGFDLNIKNNAPVGSPSNIAPAPGGNFLVDLFFAQQDLATTPGATKTGAFAGTTAGALTVGILAGASTSLLSFTATATLPTADCTKYVWLCACVKKGAGATYTDTITTNNCGCVDASTKISCAPDVSVALLSPTGALVRVDDYTPVGTAASFNLDVTINNVEAALPANNIVAAVNPNKNYVMSWTLSDGNLGAGGTDTVSIPPANVVLTPPPDADLRAKLDAGGGDSKVLSASARMAIPTAKCSATKYLCATVTKDPTATYTVDTNPANNVKCIDLVALGRRNCKPVFTNLDATVNVKEDSNGVVLHDANATDADSDTLTYSLDPATPAIFSINAADGKISLVGQPLDFEGGTTSYELTTYVADGRGGSATGTLTVSVTDANEDPVLTPTPATVTIGEHTMGNVGSTISKVDPDIANGQAITYSVSGPAGAPFTVDAGGNVQVIAPGLDFETKTQWKVEIIGVDDGSPVTPKKTGTTTVTVNVQDEPDPPTITNMPAGVSVDIYENATGGPQQIFKVLATDPDGSALTYIMHAYPIDGKFQLKATDNSVIEYITNPGFDHEKQKEYTIDIFVTDGVTAAAVGTLKVNILDVREVPKWVNLPKSVSIPENMFHGCQFLQITAVDGDNDHVNLTMDIFHHDSGRTKFDLDPWRFIRTTYNNCLNHETDPYYIANLTACDNDGCDVKNLTIYVQDIVEHPFMNPRWANLSIPENQGFNTRLPIDITKLVKDRDFNDVMTCSMPTTTYSNYIRNVGCNFYRNNPLDYDMYNPPHQFTVDMCVSDKGGLRQCLLMTITVENVDDITPVFIPNTYTRSMKEDAQGDSFVMTLTCFDRDLGYYGEIVQAVVDPTNAVASEHFAVKIRNRTRQDRDAFRTYIDVHIRNTLDIEQYSQISFRVMANSPSLTGTANVNVIITDVNDNQPTWSKPFYNLEASKYSLSGHVIGTINAYDKDIIHNDIQYSLLRDWLEFRVDPTSGDVIHKMNPVLPTWQRYILRAVARDSHPNRDQSKLVTIRIDTYEDCDILTNWTTSNAISYYTTANKNKFLDGVKSLCTPCVPRVHAMLTGSNGTALFILYFLVNDTTEFHRNLEVPKQYIPALDIFNLFKHANGTLRSLVSSNTNLTADGITNITMFCPPDPAINWILDTIEGNVVLGMLMSIGLASIVTGVLWVLKKAVFFRNSYGCDEPGKRVVQPVSNSDILVLTDDPNVMDFRYSEKPLVAKPTKPIDTPEDTTDPSPSLPGTPTPPPSEKPSPRTSLTPSSNGNVANTETFRRLPPTRR